MPTNHPQQRLLLIALCAVIIIAASFLSGAYLSAKGSLDSALSWVPARQTPSSGTVSGSIVGASPKSITLKLSNGTKVAYQLAAYTRITRTAAPAMVSLDALVAGEQVVVLSDSSGAAQLIGILPNAPTKK